MIALVQRVARASVSIQQPPHQQEIAEGLCVLLAVMQDDQLEDASWIAGKLARLRVFRDEQQRMNRSLLQTGGELLLISQFTLAGDCSRGNRPSFIAAADPELGRLLYESVERELRERHGVKVRTGVFGAMMMVEIVNDGPVTLIIQSPQKSPP